MNQIRSKRKELGLSSKYVAEHLSLPWLLYLYYETQVEEMPLFIYVEVCQILDIGFN